MHLDANSLRQHKRFGMLGNDTGRSNDRNQQSKQSEERWRKLRWALSCVKNSCCMLCHTRPPKSTDATWQDSGHNLPQKSIREHYLNTDIMFAGRIVLIFGSTFTKCKTWFHSSSKLKIRQRWTGRHSSESDLPAAWLSHRMSVYVRVAMGVWVETAVHQWVCLIFDGASFKGPAQCLRKCTRRRKVSTSSGKSPCPSNTCRVCPSLISSFKEAIEVPHRAMCSPEGIMKESGSCTWRVIPVKRTFVVFL